MRIERIDIDGFGRIAGASWTLPEGLTVFLGENEAGKSTLLNAIRALLFGFDPTRNGRVWYPAVRGGRRGGTLTIVDRDGGRWVVERHGEGGGTGSLAVRAPSGNQGGTETLDRLLGGADRDLFRTIFAFGLAELSDASSMAGDGVRGRIYGAAAGLGGASAVDLEAELRERLETLFRPSGQKPVLNALFGQMDELRARIAALERAPEEHAAAHRDRAAAEAVARRLRAEADALRQRRVRLEQSQAAAPLLAELAAAEARLATTDPALDAVPLDAAPVAEARAAALDAAGARLGDLDRALGDLDVDLGAIAVDGAILDAGAELRALDAERTALAGDESRRADAAAAIRRLDVTIAEAVARTRMPDEAALLALDDAIPVLEELAAHERALDEAAAALADAERRVGGLRDELADRADDGEDVSARPDPEDLDAAAAALRELGAARRPSLPAAWGRPVALGTVVVVGTVLGLGVAAALGPAPAAALVGAAIGLVLGAAAASALRLATASAALDPGLLARAGLPPTATPDDVDRRRDEIAVARARREEGRAEQRSTGRLRDRLAEAERAVVTASMTREAAVARWVAWLTAAGLPSTATPSVARQTLAAAGAARRAAEERTAQHAIVETVVARAAEIDMRAGAVLDRLAIGGATIAGRLATALDRLDAATRWAERRAGLEAQRTKLAGQRPALERAVAEADRALAASFASVGVTDLPALRQRTAAADERRAAVAAVESARARLLALAGSEPAAAELRAAGERLDLADVRAELVSAAARLEEVEDEERQVHASIGELNARIRDLEASAELGTLRQELASLEGQARESARTWATTAIAARLLGETRHRYERERQPDVVKAAQAYFRRITNGRFERITAPPGDGTIRVESESGEQLLPAELSRGTAEQLYLSLRFGLIEEFARHADPLPVVMDDILVNFDAPRAERAAATIRQLAERHQVVFFTCRAETAATLDPGGERTRPLG